MIFLGVDPDTSTLGVAGVNADLSINFVQIIRAKSLLQIVTATVLELLDIPAQGRGAQAFAVESQELYLGKGVNPRDILHLAQVAGAALAICRARTSPHTPGYFPRPFEWKGQQAKLPHQIKILSRAGITDYKTMGGKDPYAVPQNVDHIPGASDLNPGDWKHVVDAIGLAQYAAETYTYQQTKQAALAEARHGK